MKNKVDFEKWLEGYSGRIGFTPLQIISAMSEASDYCINRKLCKVDFWDMNSVDEFNAISKKLQSAKLFRFLHKAAANILLKAVPLYKEYLLHCASEKQIAEAEQETHTDDVRAFQWFIEETGPADDFPLLTIDMLWNFFYEKGRENLTPDIRMILDTFPQQPNLREDEKRVLKTILIMQAIDKRLGGAIELLKPTEQNISYAFEGISSGLDTACKNIAKELNRKGILVLNPIGNIINTLMVLLCLQVTSLKLMNIRKLFAKVAQLPN